MTKDYARIFAELSSSGVDAFFPTFLYQQVPSPRSLGLEREFSAPCDKDDPAFAALRDSGMTLIMPASLLYSPEKPLPPIDSDPLAQVIACAGDGVVRGVLSYDEPVHTGVSEKAASELYRRIKQISPELPVMMVHAPLTTDRNAQERQTYLDALPGMSAHADVVGFDVYPYPEGIAKIVRPGTSEIIGGAEAVRAYSDLIRQIAPDRLYLSVLQNFGYSDQFAPVARAAFSRAVVNSARGPESALMRDMALSALESGDSYIIWFGGSYTPSTSAPHWGATLDITRELSAP